MSEIKLCECGELFEGLDLYHQKDLVALDDGTTEYAGQLNVDAGFLMSAYLRCTKCGHSFFSPDTGAEPDAESVTIKLEAFPELEIIIRKGEPI